MFDFQKTGYFFVQIIELCLIFLGLFRFAEKCHDNEQAICNHASEDFTWVQKKSNISRNY